MLPQLNVITHIPVERIKAMTLLDEERRRYPRRTIRLPISLARQNEYMTLHDWYFGEIRDVSVGGARISLTSEMDLKTNALLKMLCFPVHATACKEDVIPFRMYGRVIWQDDAKRYLGVYYVEKNGPD